MPAFIQTKIGPLTSAPYEFATQENALLAATFKQFAISELNLEETATNQEIIDAINEFAGRRIFNFFRNWHQNKRRQEIELEIAKENPLMMKKQVVEPTTK